jgi:hypothetical protein
MIIWWVMIIIIITFFYKKNMKVIFLDFDGVLNSENWYRNRMDLINEGNYERNYPSSEFDPESIKELNRIISETDANVVVSSTWRIGKKIIDLQNMLNEVGFIGEIIDTTPSLFARGVDNDEKTIRYTTPRGCEIDWWLEQKGKFQRISWSLERQLEYLEKSIVKNYIILDDDSDMLYNQREHYVKCNAYGAGLDKKTADTAIKILNTPIIELYNLCDMK